VKALEGRIHQRDRGPLPGPPPGALWFFTRGRARALSRFLTNSCFRPISQGDPNMEPRNTEQECRFQIAKLEQRIAPATLIATPPAGQSGPVPSGGATVNEAAKAADGAGGVVSVT
jgi:hypothetical protein